MSHNTSNTNASRRKLLKRGAGLIGGGLIAAGFGQVSSQPGAARADEKPAPLPLTPVTPESALKRLIEGNQRFVSHKAVHPHQNAVRLKEVATGQKPVASILGCADSRVPSEIVFDQGFGDLFVCRVAGNVATPEEIGSLEFGAAVLGSQLIVVMGHERCGAVIATLKGNAVPGQIGSILDAIRPALDSVKGLSGSPEQELEQACKANVRYQISKLKASPVLQEKLAAGTLKIVGGYYDLDTGVVSLIS